MNMEMTLQARENRALTLPVACKNRIIQYQKPRLAPRTQIGNYTLLAPLTVTEVSELWYGCDGGERGCVIKMTGQKPDIELLSRIQSRNAPFLTELLFMGEYRGMWYEVTPWYREGNLGEEEVSEEMIQKTVLPSLIQALNTLHAEGIAHNDIKPENLFWDDDKKKVRLGDFGCISEIGTVPPGYTPAYAAPEVLMNGAGKRSTDWCSVGLTLAALRNGKSLLSAGNTKEMIFQWENGVRYEGGSREFQRLINGMIQIEPRRRLGPKAAESWIKGSAFGGESRKTGFKEKKEQFFTVKFENPPLVAATIPMLLGGIASHWDYAAFLFRQKKFDRFLDQFDHKWLEICKQIRKTPNQEDALYMLTLELTEGRRFIWRGRLYNELSELEQEWENGAQGEDNVVTFLQRGLAGIYLRKNGAQPEQIEFVKSLQASSYYHATESCFQLFQALKGEDGFEWKGTRFTSVADLIKWLDAHYLTLDEEIAELMESKYFDAWFEYMGMRQVLDQIRRRCQD